MLVAGLIAGPGYYLYCTQLSGKHVGKFPISGRANTWSLPGGVTLTFGGTGAFKPFSIDLDPRMNPVGFNWQGSVSGMVMRYREYNEYKASLYLGKQPLMVETFSISRDEKETGTAWKWVSIGSLDIPQAGQYHFVLEEVTQPRLSVGSVHIEVRRNVVIPSMQVVIAGGALAVAGFVLIFIMLWRTKEKQPAGNQEAYDAFLAAHKPLITGRHMLIFFGVSVILMGALFLVVSHFIMTESDVPVSTPIKAADGQSPVPAQAVPPSATTNPPVELGPIVITEVEPNPARIGEPITLRGSNFGRPEDHGVSVGGHGMKVALDVTKWEKDSVTVTIPNDPRFLLDRSYYYRIERKEPFESSNLFMFTFESKK